MTHTQKHSSEKPHLREVRKEWKVVGEKLAKGSQYVVRAELRSVAYEAPKFVWVWIRAMYTTVVVLGRMSYNVFR